MILFDVEYWQDDEYRHTLAGPFETRLEADEAAQQRRDLWGQGCLGEVRVTQFDAVELHTQGRGKLEKVRLFMVRSD